MSRDERPNEQEAVRTTIVGGRPPGSGQAVGPIPRGIEVLVKKAAVDPAFKQVLLEKRAKAAGEIDLKLEPAEVAMLDAVPIAQLETIIANTKVTDLTRSAFLGRAAAVMLAALGVSVQGCGVVTPPVAGGSRPMPPPPPPEPKPDPKFSAEPSKDLPPAAAQSPGSRPDPVEPKPPSQEATPPAPTGIRPDRPPVEPKEEPKTEPPPKPNPDQVTRGVRPDVPMTKGIQPDEILPPGFGADEIKKRVEAMVKLLGNSEENTRTEAKQALLGMGPAILPALKEAKAPSADAEKDVQAIVQVLEERLKK